MNFYILSVFLVGLVAVHAAPAQQDANLKKDFEPVEKQVRALVDATNKAVDDFKVEAQGAGERVLEYAKDLIAPMDDKERANIPSNVAARLLSFQDNVGAETKSLMEKTLQDNNNVQASGRSAINAVDDTVKALRDKYLTPNGQQLIKSLVQV